MKRSSLILAVCAALAVAGAAYFPGLRSSNVAGATDAGEVEPAAPHANDADGLAAHRAPSPATAKLPATQSPEQGRHAAAGDDARELALGIERALVASDAQRRDDAFAFLLPELMRVDPDALTALHARQPAGEARDLLRDEIARQWITRRRDAAVLWMKALPESDRAPAARMAVRALAAASPGDAVAVADELGVGRDDGSLAHQVQIWAASDPDAAMRWLEQRPGDPLATELRRRIEAERAPRSAAR